MHNQDQVHNIDLLLYRSSDQLLSRQFYPAVLERNYRKLEESTYQYIFLPANDKFPRLCLLRGSHIGHNEEWRLAGKKLVPKERKRIPVRFDKVIDPTSYEVLLEQNRALVGRKILPGFKLERTRWCMDGTATTIFCDIVTGIGPKHDGSYLAAGNSYGIYPDDFNCPPPAKVPEPVRLQAMQALMPLIGACSPQERASYWHILKERHPDYAWKA
ncbi:MAG: hypothetical protein K2W82_15765 [Candidatus Obscuribacterales bacterium]|nr:hypothetical protein [Candidatus Obscuribacterales bacterium]